MVLVFLAWLPNLALAWIPLSHIGKISFLFMPYKAWTNGWRVPLVWLMPYKAWRGKRSFQCGTTRIHAKARLGNQAKNTKTKGKNSWAPTITYPKIKIYNWKRHFLDWSNILWWFFIFLRWISRANDCIRVGLVIWICARQQRGLWANPPLGLTIYL